MWRYPSRSACSTRRAQARPRSSQVPNPIAGILAPLASTNCMLEVLEQIEPIMSRRRGAANNAARPSDPRQSGKHRLRGMGYHGKKRPRRSARHAFALLPVSDGLNRHAQPCREFQLRQARAPAKVANRRKRPCRFGRRPKPLPARAETPARPATRRSVRPLSAASAACSIQLWRAIQDAKPDPSSANRAL